MSMEIPQDIDMERRILGAVIEHPETFEKVAQYFSNIEVLHHPQHRAIWRIIGSMRAKKKHIDLVTICSEVKRVERGGIKQSYIAEIVNDAALKDNIEVYAENIYEKYLYRRIVHETKNIQEIANSNSPEVYETITSVHSLLGRLIDIRPDQKFDISEELDQTIDSITKKEEKLVKTGYLNLDKFAGGLTRGEITIIGGRPGHGKSTMMLNMLSKMIADGKKVILFNRELTNTEVLKKLLTLESGNLSYTKVRKGIYEGKDLKELSIVKQFMKENYVEDKFRMFDNIRDLPRSIAEIKKFQPDVIFDDYIQLVAYKGKEEQRRLQLEQLVNDYKWVAKENNCVVVLASQLNRGLEARVGKNQRPQLSDLAESGAIEQVAENVFFVFYKYKITGAEEEKQDMILVASKVRYGESGETILYYEGDKAKIYNSMDELLNPKGLSVATDDLPF